MNKIHEGLSLSASQWLVFGFCVAVTAFVILADILIIRIWGVEHSISRVVGRIGFVYVSLIFALAFWAGFVIGHKFCHNGG